MTGVDYKPSIKYDIDKDERTTVAMNYYDEKGILIKEGQTLVYTDDSSPSEYLSLSFVKKIDNELYIICEEAPDKLWEISDFSGGESILEDFEVLQDPPQFSQINSNYSKKSE